MTTVERLPPACAFALSVLSEFQTDPDAVPEEAVEAAQQHLSTCPRCVRTQANPQGYSPVVTPAPSTLSTSTRKKKRTERNPFDDATEAESAAPRRPKPGSFEAAYVSSAPLLTQPVTPLPETAPEVPATPEQVITSSVAKKAEEPAIPTAPTPQTASAVDALHLLGVTNAISCQQCRERLKQYAEAIDNGEDTSERFAEVEAHLLGCEAGCLVLLDIYRQEAKATRKYRRRPVRNPFSAIGWEATGFFRGGQVPMSPMALSYGTLILLLLVASLTSYLSIRWDDARYYHAPVATVPTPDGIGLSDGLHVYDACNANSYRDKRAASQALQSGNQSQAQLLLKSAMNAPLSDTTGCNGAEAAIYLEDSQVRQSGHAFGLVVLSFDSGPGVADPHGGTDRHVLYAAYTQELIGAYIGLHQYNQQQMQTANAPLLYLVLANSTGTPSGAMQIANDIVALKAGKTDGLLLSSSLQATPSASSTASPPTPSVSLAHPLLAVLGLGPNTLTQNILPVLCTTGVPLISATATGQFLLDMVSQTSLYQHCMDGFSFIRFSSSDMQQSELAAGYAYNTLHVHRAALLYDPNDPSSSESVQGFQATFLKKKHTQIVAQETTPAGPLLDTADGAAQATHDTLLAQLNDALRAKPELLFAPLATNDILVLAQAIAQLPQNQQPILMLGGTFVPPSSLQRLVQWTRQQQLTLPRIFMAQSSVVLPPTGNWQKQFYASLCTSFAASSNYCSGTSSVDQGALLFADSMEMVTTALGTLTGTSTFPTTPQLVQRISKEQFAGVSGPVALRVRDSVTMVSTKAIPVLLSLQGDGSIQVVG